jgi:gentisate 1,2-dioxygenase
VDGEVMEWAMGDVIAVPAWRTYSHAVDSESFMVRASDEPVMRAIDMLRDEVLTART